MVWIHPPKHRDLISLNTNAVGERGRHVWRDMRTQGRYSSIYSCVYTYAHVCWKERSWGILRVPAECNFLSPLTNKTQLTFWREIDKCSPKPGVKGLVSSWRWHLSEMGPSRRKLCHLWEAWPSSNNWKSLLLLLTLCFLDAMNTGLSAVHSKHAGETKATKPRDNYLWQGAWAKTSLP